MVWLTDIDLHSQILETFRRESEGDGTEVLNNLEQQNIAIIKSKIGGRYDVKAVFNEYQGETHERHYLIIKILVKLVLYDLIRRNAARKVPTDYVRDWEWAMKTLEKIKSGSERPEGLTELTDDNGSSPIVMYGNNKNTSNYI